MRRKHMEGKDLAGLTFLRKQIAKETLSSERLVSLSARLGRSVLGYNRLPWFKSSLASHICWEHPHLTGDLQQNAKNCKKHSQTFSKSQLPNCLHCSLSKLYLLPFGHYILPLPQIRGSNFASQVCLFQIHYLNRPPKTNGWNLKIPP